MTWFIEIAKLFAFGIPGWFLLERLRMPAAPIVGAMFSAGALTMLGAGHVAAPPLFNVLLQILLGLFIGLRVTPETRQVLRVMGKPAMLVSIWWLVAALLTGALLYRFSSLDLATALLSSVPGGVAEMSLLSLSLGGNPAMVALLQSLRLASVLFCVPLLTPYVRRRFGGGANACPCSPEKKPAGGEAEGASTRNGGTAPSLAPGGRLLSVSAAAAGGAFLSFLHVPAGAFLGAFLSTGILGFFGIRLAGLPPVLRTVAQIGLGAIIGSRFDMQMLRSLENLLLPILFTTVFMLLWGFVLAFLLHRLTRWNTMTCFVSTCAGGLSQMGIIAEDIGADPVAVSILHLIRLFTILIVMPPLFKWLLLS
jgi:hypothetical protein